MKICLVTTAFPRWPGDAQGSFIWEAARAIRQQGLSVRVVAMHMPGARTREWMDGIEVLRPRYLLPERWEILRREGGGLPITWKKYPWARILFLPFGAVHTLAVARAAHDADLVHANWTLSAAAGRLSQPIHRRPLIATLQGSDVFQAARTRNGARFARFAIDGSAAITVLSRALARATIALGVPAERVVIVPNGVDTQRFVPRPQTERQKVILFVGSFIERKGVRHLLAAAPQILRRLPGYRIDLIGEGPQEAELRALADRLGVTDRVAFRGFLPQTDVADAMQRSRLFVLPSLEEGLGVVLLEALACGTPIVASNVDGIPDVVAPEVGALVPPAQPDELADAVVAMLAEPVRWAERSTNARARAVEQFDWQVVAARYVRLYQSILEGANR